jgi:hypothetical protein
MALRIPVLAALLLTGSCLAAGGHPLVYSTFLGGSNDDQAYALTIDRDGNAYFAGQTSSTDFPVLNGSPLSNTSPGLPNLVPVVDSVTIV